MRDIFGEVTDNRTPVNKTELDAVKLECFNRILDNSHRYYEEFDTSDGLEYGFDSEGFGEWVEEQIVDFHHLKECEVMNNTKKSLEEQSERMQKFNSEQIALHEKKKNSLEKGRQPTS